ncbi:triacylglycerol lipase [Nocardia asteroides]|nr:lipase family protein [Nocardia asteroides]UGT49348.1 triacylglycerol lipase [Nocardia asteroides]SFL87447.1 triacylglycerol lipase [Nocardia asteroides]VEG38202.1 Secretory lipase [Nocardia asteroides]
MAPVTKMSRRLAALAVAVTAIAPALSVAVATAEPAGTAPVAVQPAPAVAVPPELDPAFYRPPAELVAAKQPGEIIAARQVNVANAGLIPVNVDAWQVSYRSTNTRDEAIAAVATVLKPRGSTPDKLVSMQIAEDSLAAYCSPSYAVQQWSAAAALGQIVAPLEFVVAQAQLQQGWAVVIPDHQGPDSAFGVGPLGARITLDGIRAARDFAPMRLAPDTRVGMYGYSGGAIVTGHAAELAQSYAPELNIVGAAIGGVPADFGPLLDIGNGQIWSGMIMAAVLGLGREYREFGELLDRDLDPLGQGLSVIKGGLCVQYNTALFPFLNMKGMLRVPEGDPMRNPVVRDVLDKTRMGKAVPDMPMFIWQANPDELIPVGPVNTLVDTYCQSPDAQVQYIREHLGEHITTEVSGSATALLWLRDRLDGAPAAPGCRTADAGLLALNPDGLALLANTFGETIASFFGKPIGVR